MEWLLRGRTHTMRYITVLSVILLGVAYAGLSVVSRDDNKKVSFEDTQTKIHDAEKVALFGLRAKAEQGDPEAQMRLAIVFWNGDGVKKDVAEAMKWGQKAVVEYRSKADQGDKKAECALGRIYDHGLPGITPDLSEAMKWYRKSADQGYADAQLQVGSMYENGRSVPQDSSEAMKWYQKAADQDNAGAQDAIGWMYQHGHGVKTDLEEASFWHLIAITSKHSTNSAPMAVSIPEFEETGQHLTDEQLSEVKKRIEVWEESHNKTPSPVTAP